MFIARAIAQQTPLLILDEPTSFLDLKHQWDVLVLLRRMTQEQGTTIIATLHDLNIAGQWCSRLALMSDGKIAADGPPRDVMSAATLESVYGLPIEVACRPDGSRAVHLPPPPVQH